MSEAMKIICENGNALHNGILDRNSAYTPSVKEEPDLREHFTANPDSRFVYLFFDGHIEDGEAYNARLINRQAQLNSIAQDGFPVLVSRGSVLRFDSCPFCEAKVKV